MGTGLAQLEAAQLQEEGYFAGTSAGIAKNNPYNLTDTSGNLLSFSKLEEGLAAGDQYLKNAIAGINKNYTPGESLGEFESTYTGDDPNAPSNLAKILQTNTSTPVSAYSTGPGLTAAQVASASSASTSPTFKDLLNGITGYALGGPSGAAVGAATGKPINFLGISISVVDVVAVLAGLVLLAGAVFGFRNLTTTVITGVKKGAELGAMTA